jgi:hypothetical protein
LFATALTISDDSLSAHESSIALPGSPALWAGSFTFK